MILSGRFGVLLVTICWAEKTLLYPQSESYTGNERGDIAGKNSSFSRTSIARTFWNRNGFYPASILRKSTSGRHRPVSYPNGPMTARYRFTYNADWVDMFEAVAKRIAIICFMYYM